MVDSYRDILSSVYSNALAKAWCKLLEDKGYLLRGFTSC